MLIYVYRKLLSTVLRNAKITLNDDRWTLRCSTTVGQSWKLHSHRRMNTEEMMSVNRFKTMTNRPAMHCAASLERCCAKNVDKMFYRIKMDRTTPPGDSSCAEGSPLAGGVGSVDTALCVTLTNRVITDSYWIQSSERRVKNKYVGPLYCYCPTEMYASSVACCPLVSHGEYVDGTERRTDGRQTVTVRFPLWTRPSSEVTCRLQLQHLWRTRAQLYVIATRSVSEGIMFFRLSRSSGHILLPLYRPIVNGWTVVI